MPWDDRLKILMAGRSVEELSPVDLLWARAIPEYQKKYMSPSERQERANGLRLFRRHKCRERQANITRNSSTGGGRGNVVQVDEPLITIREDVTPEQRPKVLAHEVGHMIDDMAKNIMRDGIKSEGHPYGTEADAQRQRERERWIAGVVRVCVEVLVSRFRGNDIKGAWVEAVALRWPRICAAGARKSRVFRMAARPRRPHYVNIVGAGATGSCRG